MIWIVYARYEAQYDTVKRISDIFRSVCDDRKKSKPSDMVRIDEVRSKKEFLHCVKEINEKGLKISEWHMIGYGVPYGPLMGSEAWPEEISPHEWNSLQIPLADEARAWFYMEGSNLWLAPFLASLYGIECSGCRSIPKTGFPDMQAFPPGVWSEAADYNPIASLYAEAFSDITVRHDECRWIKKRLKNKPNAKVLDIGCGNGALLAHLAPLIAEGTGVDISSAAIEIAARSNGGENKLSFLTLDGPKLPFNDGTFDFIISMLSFRYLDWDPILLEMSRVLIPGGRILIVDMVASRARPYEIPNLLFDKLKNYWHLRKYKNFSKSLKKLVVHPDWQRMVSRNPMHRMNEFERYLKSRFPQGKMDVINIGSRAKILAFDSGPADRKKM